MKQLGFSLVELLVCFFISMLLTGILIQHLLSVSRQFHETHALLDEAIELQWVFDVMRTRIYHAGFTPCKALRALHVIDTRDVPDTLDAIHVQHTPDPKLVIQKMDERAFGRAQFISANQLRVKDLTLKTKHPVLIADCRHAEVHAVQEKSGDVITLQKPLVFQYSDEVYLGVWIKETFLFRKPKGLFFKQQHVDYMAPAEHVQFRLKKHGLGLKFMMDWVSKQNKHYQLTANVPCG